MQPPSPGTGQARARRHPRRRRRGVRIPLPPDPGNRQASDRGARPQPRVSEPGRSAVRLSARRRGAPHRLRQDHAGADHGGGDGEHPGDRAVRRTDAERLVEGQTRRLRHRRLVGPRGTGGRADRQQGIPRHRDRVGAVGRPLQHHGHRLDDERAGRGAWHVAAGLRRDPRAVPRARPDRLRHRRARGRDRARGSAAFRHPHPQGIREHHRRQFGDRRLDQRADPHQRDRPPHRREACDRGLGEGRLRRAAPGQHAARRLLSRRGVLPRRRIARGDEPVASSPASPRRRADHQRQDHGRERQARQGRGRRRHQALQQADEAAGRLQGVQGQPV